ncbi:HNH endonuclease [Aldersonia sp. NBC_00410]|uniref:HNH endonuclease signature motif containing protein n=1 Tax=Aldersonia sp. NBC_00410 TaxID=2975954 RepID=UPI002258D01E|nr:HNH endonuclease signature motif containing protein [Aldersonia sp. NBC_00410]MCX5044879.1 HNH endonuclease [Aldersonia sp. NBC_00410]
MLDDGAVLDELAAAAVAENCAAYRKVVLAGRLWETWVERDAELGRDGFVDCGNNALAEIAVRLGCSKAVAEGFAVVGMELRLRLPLVRAAFAAGELDFARVRRIVHDTLGFTPGTVALAEPDMLAAARVLSPGPLAGEVDTILIRVAPAEVAARREEAERDRRIRKRRVGPLARLEVDLSPVEAEAAWQRVTEVAGTVCGQDRRNRQYRMVDAFLALVHGENRLGCECGRSDCAAVIAPVSLRRRTPLVQIGIDVASLLGLRSEPAYLPGYGPVDPELARQLAADATWQGMLTELHEIATDEGLIADPAPGSLSDSMSGRTPTQDRLCTSTFRARGSRRPGAVVPAPRTPAPPAPPPFGTVAAIGHGAAELDRIFDAAACTGHGGHHHPPPGAFEYRPDAATTAVVRARDRHCRFPGCRTPAAQCQLDHVVEFDYHRPDRGGWTVRSNLQCLCAFHHQLKTMKLWHAQMAPGGQVAWRSSYGHNLVTTPAAGLTSAPTATLTAPVGSGPLAWQQIPDPTDDEEPPY